MKYTATCLFGLEGLLGGEIDALGGAEEIEITVRGKDQQQDDAEDHTKYTHKRPPFLSFLNIPSRAGGVN